MSQYRLSVSYGQLAVFDADLAQPFNDWTHTHVRQGFAWRPGSVSFATLDAAGPLAVAVGRSSSADQRSVPCVRAIRVPFTVLAHHPVEISTISEAVSEKLAPGEYALTFSHGRAEDGSMWATLDFERVGSPVSAAILRVDSELSPPPELLMAAAPA